MFLKKQDEQGKPGLLKLYKMQAWIIISFLLLPVRGAQKQNNLVDKGIAHVASIKLIILKGSLLPVKA